VINLLARVIAGASLLKGANSFGKRTKLSVVLSMIGFEAHELLDPGQRLLEFPSQNMLTRESSPKYMLKSDPGGAFIG
jgi:hypothetical protein